MVINIVCDKQKKLGVRQRDAKKTGKQKEMDNIYFYKVTKKKQNISVVYNNIK